MVGELVVRIFALCAVLALASHARGQGSCPSIPFSVAKGGERVSLDVASLRAERPELYEILRQRVVQDLYFGPEISDLAKRASDGIVSKPGFPKDPDEREKVVKLMAYMLGEPFQQMTFACGSLVDGVAGELSLAFSKPESEHLARMVTDPVHERFLAFIVRLKPRHAIPAELRENMNLRVIPEFAAMVRERCKASGLPQARCDTFSPGPLPPR